MTHTTKNGRVRERLDGRSDPENIRKRNNGLKRARAVAPRNANGKVQNNFKYTNVLNAEFRSSRTFVPTSQMRLPKVLRNEFVRLKLLKLLRKGVPYMTVCAFCGIRVPAFLETLEKGKAGFSKAHVKFYNSVRRAEAQGEIAILADLKKHKSNDWRVSAWHLERVFPEKYGRVDRIRAENRTTISVTTDQKKDLGNKVLSDDTARELARRLIDGEAQLHFNALPAPENV